VTVRVLAATLGFEGRVRAVMSENAAQNVDGNGGTGRMPAAGGAVHRVPVDVLLDADSPRLSGVNHAHIARLTECGASLPPVVVHRGTMRVIDGMHRLNAARRNKRELIEVTFFEGTEEEAFIHAVELNVKHGLPLSLGDRKAAALRILVTGADLSDRTVAAKTGLSDKTVATIRRRLGAEIPQPHSRHGRDGRLYQIGGTEERRRRVAQLIADQPSASLREIASAAGVSPAMVNDVRKRISAGVDPIARKPRTRSLAQASSAGIRSVRPTPLSREETRGGTNADDIRAALEQLRADPSIRDKEAGRALLRWLSGHAIDMSDIPEHADAVPPHRAALVAVLARHVASAWMEFAHRLDSIEESSSAS
jgi:hypothetical protein